MVSDTSEVKLRIRERYVVQITPAFKCSGVWPRSGAHWPLPHIPWPHPNLVAEVKTEGFDLLSKVKVTKDRSKKLVCLHNGSADVCAQVQQRKWLEARLPSPAICRCKERNFFSSNNNNMMKGFSEFKQSDVVDRSA